MYSSIAIFLMLIVSLISVTVTNNKMFVKKDNLVLTFNNFNTASKDQNYFILLLDTIDSEVFYKEWQKDDRYKDLFTDFTFYNNALSYYPYTRDSLPLILTGKINRNEKEFSEYSAEAYNNSPLFQKLKEQNYNINLYDTNLVWNGKKNINILNNNTNSGYKVNVYKFFMQELKYVLYKYLPYPLKRFSSIQTFDFNICFDKYSPYLHVDNNFIESNPKLEISNQKEFKYIRTEGGHVPFDMDENLIPIKNGTYEQKVHGNLKFVKNFLDRLKENNAYDNSVIVIMADHGFDETGQNNLLKRMNPLLVIKGVNENHKVIFSDKPISYAEINDTLVELIDGKQSTELFTDMPDKRTRTILWQRYTKEDHMVEYETTGKANEISKFKKTGMVFDR